MTSDSSNIQSEQDRALYQFLLQKADEYGFSPEKKLGWAKCMLDTSRGEELVEFLRSYFNINVNLEDSRALDIGCGFGALLMALAKYFNQVSGIEIVEERVLWAKKRSPNAEVICGSATKLPWQNESFDLVTSTDVFEHISYKEQELVASEMLRVLKPGGHGFITVPNRFQVFDEHNLVYFGTWMPSFLREKYVKTISKNNSFLQCWERTGYGWKRLFENQGFKVTLKPIQKRKIVPPSRYEIYLTK